MSAKRLALLDCGDSPVIGPNTAAELRAWIVDAEAFEGGLERPTEERIDTLVTRFSFATAKRAPTKAEAHEMHGLYWRVLRDVPLVDLARAFDDLLKTATFMPRPAEVRAAAFRYTAKRSYRLSRARFLVWKHEQEYRAPIEPVSAAEVEAIKQAAAAQMTQAQTLEGRCPTGSKETGE